MTGPPPCDPGAVILAAGGSRRLGEPKQLLAWRGATLLRRAATAAVDAGCRPVIVVLGAAADRCRAELAGLSVAVAENGAWEAGLAGSLQVGLSALLARAPETSGALFVPADQPLLTADLLRRLVREHRAHPERPVACRYASAVGAPALIPARLFAEVAGLAGDTGAREILRRHHRDVVAVPFPGGELDIDTPADLEDLLGRT